MSIPKYVSAEEYSRQSGIGVEEVKRLCRTNQLKHFMTEGGYYKIATDSDSVPIELFEEEKKKRIEAETTLQLLQKILLENPKLGDTISHTGGLRKIRIPMENKGKGKRSGARVIYIDIDIGEK